MVHQNIWQYAFEKVKLHPINMNMDLSLASDEVEYDKEIVFSDNIIAFNNGDKLPISIDMNDSGSTASMDLVYGEYDTGNVIISKNFSNPKKTDLSCFTAETLCDIGLTGTDNGLVDQMSGATIDITMGLLDDHEKFDRLKFDRRMKLFQVTGYTSSPNVRFSGNPDTVLYEVITQTGATEGIYHELYGGFYQGFHKLHGYDYDIFPTRMEKGWSVEILMRPRLYHDHYPGPGETTLNKVYPENRNIFFYMGTRGENKYHHHADGEMIEDVDRVTKDLGCLMTCACSDTGITNSDCVEVYPPTEITIAHLMNPCQYYNKEIEEPDKDPAMDSMSNNIALKLCGDPSNPKLGVKVLRFEGNCAVSGACSSTGTTYTTGYTVTEYCSPDGIYDICPEGSNFLLNEHWIMADVVFERYNFIKECYLPLYGGLRSITEIKYLESLIGNSVSLIIPPMTHNNETGKEIELIELNQKWLDEKKHRMGRLKFYVNGKLFYTIEDFEEIIPRGLNTRKERQIGVPYNISIGGGTQGLRESLIFSGCPESMPTNYIQDPELMPNNILSGTTLSGLTTNILIEQNFAGTLEGAISQFRMYVEPLSAAQIQHNFRLLKDRFRLFDYFCDSCK